MWCDIKVTASYLWASSAIFVIKPKHDWQSRKTRQKLHNRTNICCNKHWKDCDVIILYLFLSHRLPVISYVVISVFSDQDHLNVPSMTEQERYLECFFFFFLQFSKHLSPFPFLHYSSFFFCFCVLFFASSRTHKTWGHCDCADSSLFFILPQAEWEATREKDKEKRNCQTDRESKGIHLKL